MISKQQAKFIKSLQYKKYRNKAETFIVEGSKNVIELLHSDFEITRLYATEPFINDYPVVKDASIHMTVCTPEELSKAGTFQTNTQCLALVKMQKEKECTEDEDHLILVLDDIRDPGNLGTIIRIADWYGIRRIMASETSADFYNPKVINASMGSFSRVQVLYRDLEEYLTRQKRCKVYGTFLDGENVHKASLEVPAIIIMGNESHGINPSLSRHIDQRISIPRFGKAESLNVAVSTAIICDRFMGNIGGRSKEQGTRMDMA